MAVSVAPSAPSSRIERAVEEAAHARQAGRHREAVDRLSAAAALLGSGPVRRELRVAVARETGLALLGLDRAREARDQLLLALERGDGEAALADPVRGALATLALMTGDSREARQWLSERGRDRRATLLALARLELFEGDVSAAEQTLQACEQAPGGAAGLGPPSSALRALAALWGGRADQARMLHDGVATAHNAQWDLVRLLILRATWVQTRDGRYLQLALGAAEQLRFGEREGARPAGLAAAAAAHHAALLNLRGEVELAVDAANTAFAQLGALAPPEWPRQAILLDLAVVFRDADLPDRHQATLDAFAELDPGPWAPRVRQVTGPRAEGALAARAGGGARGHDDGRLIGVALRLLDERSDPRATFMSALCDAVGAMGGAWVAADGRSHARVGAALGERAASVSAIGVGAQGTIELHGGSPAAIGRLDARAVEALARAARERLAEQRGLAALRDDVALAEAGRRAAEEALERSRRPGSADLVGGHFSAVVGRSEALREVLDRLGVLAGLNIGVLFEGAAGAGRRHLARALANADGARGDAPCPMLDAALVPSVEQLGTLERLVASARPVGERRASYLVANAEHLGPDAASWLIDAAGRAGARALVTLDGEARGPVSDALRVAFAPGRVLVPGLDERLEDLPLLVDAFAREAGRRPEDVSTAARAVLARRAWSGHVAELRSAIHRAAVRADKASLLPEHLDSATPETPAHLSDSMDLGYHDAVRTFRRRLLVHALEVTGGNRTRAAELLGLQRTYFMRLIRDLDDV